MINTTTKTCSNCSHAKMCKYREETEKMSSDIKWISKDVPVNIKINFECIFFEKATSGVFKWEDYEPTWDYYADNNLWAWPNNPYITTDHTEVSKK